MNFGTLILSLTLAKKLESLDRELGIVYQETAKMGFASADDQDMALMVDRSQELQNAIAKESAAFTRIAARA